MSKINKKIFAEGFYTRIYICPDCKKEVLIGETVYSHECKNWGILDRNICRDCHVKVMES
jgi:DNA-directed RNA polymerase subunit RPC12/RpoP